MGRDLKNRTFQFALDVRRFLKKILVTAANREDGRQLLRSSGSVGANYLEADNSLSSKDSLLRIRICLKESRESEYWLRLLDLKNRRELNRTRQILIQECSQLTKMFATIVRKLKG